MFFITYFILIGKLLFFIFKKRRAVITISSIFIFVNIFVSNFDILRYQTKFDNLGNEYVHDLLTGKKWKKRINF